MTTKPRAKKFRIRRSASLPSDAISRPAPENAGTRQTQAPLGDIPFATPIDDGFGDKPYPGAAAQTLSEPDEVASENAIAAIRKEGLTGR